jgi:hypothetical protein
VVASVDAAGITLRLSKDDVKRGRHEVLPAATDVADGETILAQTTLPVTTEPAAEERENAPAIPLADGRPIG